MLYYLQLLKYMLPAAFVCAAVLFVLVCFFKKISLKKYICYYPVYVYGVLLALILLFWNVGTETARGTVDILPLWGTLADYAVGLRSTPLQFILNIIIFIPFGFLLPVLFYKKVDRIYKAALITLVLCVFVETIQYFGIRNADIDDVIANTTGASIGFSLYVFTQAICEKRGCSLFRGERICTHRRLVYSFFTVLLAICVPLLLIIIETNTPMGIVRYNRMRFPQYVTLDTELPRNHESKRMAYKMAQADRGEKAEEIIARFELKGKYVCEEEQKYNNKYYRYVSENGDWEVGVRKNGTWWYISSAAEQALDTVIENEEYITIAQNAMEPFMQDGESLIFSNIAKMASSEDGDCAVDFYVWSRTSECLSFGNVTVVLTGMDVTSVKFMVTRGTPYKQVDVISPQAALEYARIAGVGDYLFDNGSITGVRESYIVRGDYLLPSYEFAGNCESGGKKEGWTYGCDAVQR